MKKVLTIFLAAVMALSCFAACGGNKKSDEKIKIALITNTTGDYAQYGVPVHNAALMYFEEVNKAGGINGKQLEILEYDDKGDGVESVNAFNLANTKGISAVFGSVLTGPTIALADATFEANMPQITASATSAYVTVMSDTNKVRTNVFRSCFLDPFQGEKMAQYAVEVLKANTAAIFYETGSDYSEAIVEGIEETAKKLNLSIVSKEAFATGDVDFKAQMTNVAGKNPDVVFMPIYYKEAGLAITALRTANCKAQVIGGDGFGSVKNYATAADLEGSLYFSGYAPASTDEIKAFEAAYKAKWKEEVPNMFAPLAYDAAMLLCKGIEGAEAKKLTPGSAEYKQAIIDTIKASNATKGITGSYTFNEFNNPTKSIAIIELKNGSEDFKEFY